MGEIGWWNSNIKLNLDVLEMEHLPPQQDILAIVDYSNEISYRMGNLNDIDHLKNWCVRFVVDLLQEQMKLASNHLQNLIREIICKVAKCRRPLTPKGLIPFILMMISLCEFFGSHPNY